VDLEVKIGGMGELKKSLLAMEKSLLPDHVEPIMLNGAKTIAKAVKTKIRTGPKPITRTGDLEKGAVAKMLGRIGSDPAPAIAAMDYKKAPHSYLVEYGHDLVRGGKKGKGGVVIGHVAPAPYFRPTVDEQQEPTLQEVTNKLGKLIEEAMK
jgi:hypothetical protein